MVTAKTVKLNGTRKGKTDGFTGSYEESEEKGESYVFLLGG